MTKSCLMLVMTLVILTPILAQQEQPKPTGVLATLKVGQNVNLKEVGERYSIMVVGGDIPQPHKVLEVGTDFIVVKDLSGLNETRIPLTSLKSVVHFKGFEKK
jgi:hypothetical protein